MFCQPAVSLRSTALPLWLFANCLSCGISAQLVKVGECSLQPVSSTLASTLADWAPLTEAPSQQKMHRPLLLSMALSASVACDEMMPHGSQVCRCWVSPRFCCCCLWWGLLKPLLVLRLLSLRWLLSPGHCFLHPRSRALENLFYPVTFY